MLDPSIRDGLEDVAHFNQQSGVMVQGRWLSEGAVQSRLAEIAALYEPER